MSVVQIQEMLVKAEQHGDLLIDREGVRKRRVLSWKTCIVSTITSNYSNHTRKEKRTLHGVATRRWIVYNVSSAAYFWLRKSEVDQLGEHDMTFNQMQEMLIKAEQHGACSEALAKLRSFDSVENALQNPEAAYWLYWYARNVIQGRWPEAEPYLVKDACLAYFYSKTALKGRWKEAEPYLVKDLCWGSNYAKRIIKGRWPALEQNLKNDPYWAYSYSAHILQKRCPELEDCIMQDSYWWEKYQDIFKMIGAAK